MNRAFPLLALLLLAGPLLSAVSARAWASANRFGGSSFHTWGASGHTNTWGGSTEHVAGEGTEHTNAWGGNTDHAYGGGTQHTNVYLISNKAPHASTSSECPAGVASLPLVHRNDSGADLRIDRCQVGFAELCC